jgi:hypothetical protein
MVEKKTLAERVADVIIARVHAHFNVLLANKQFKIDEGVVVFEKPLSEYVYEDPDNNRIYLEEMHGIDELLCHKLSMLCVKQKLMELVRSRLTSIHGIFLDACMDHENDVLKVFYDPHLLFSSEKNTIPKDILEEYIDVFNMFQDVAFYNHSNSYIGVSNRPRWSISFKGYMVSKPHREYYIVFETEKYYTVQVYDLHETGKRKKMLFGVWIDSERKRISEPYFIDY